MKNYFLALMCFLALGFASSCKDDEEDCADAVTDASAKATTMINALTAYSTNPSTANCNAYVDALEAYIDAAQPIVDCPGLTQQQQDLYQQQLDDAEDELATISC